MCGILITCPPYGMGGRLRGPGSRVARLFAQFHPGVTESARLRVSLRSPRPFPSGFGLGHRVASPFGEAPAFFRFFRLTLVFWLRVYYNDLMEQQTSCPKNQTIQIAVRVLIDALPVNSRPIGEAIQSLLNTEMDRVVAEAANSAPSATPYPHVRFHVWEHGGSDRATTTMMRTYMCKAGGEWTVSHDTLVSRPWAEEMAGLGLATWLPGVYSE